MPNDLLASSVPQGPKDLLADQSPPKDVLANPPSSAALPSAPPAIANVGGATVTPKINLSPDIAHPLGRLEAIAQDPGYQAATAYDKAAQAYTANPEQYRQDTLEPVTVPAKTVNVDWEVPPRDDIGTRLQGPPALHSYPIQVPEQRKSALFSTPSTATDYNAVESPLNKVAREAYAKTGDVRYLQHAAMTETFNKPGPGVNIPGVKPETSGHLYMELGEEDLPPNFKRAAEQNAAAIQDPNNVGLQVPHPWILQGPNGKYAVRRGEARDQYIQWWEKQKKIGGAEQKMSAEDQAAALDQRRRDNQYDQTPYPGALRAALQPEEQGDVERAKAQLLGLPRPENTGAEDFLNLPGYVGGKAKSATAGVLGAASHILPKLQVNPLYGQPKQDPGLRAANEALGESARKTLEANPVDSKTGKFIGAIPDIAGAVGATYFGGPAGAAAYGAALSGGNTYQSAFEDVYGKARHEGLDDQAAKNLAHAKAFGPAMVSAATGAVLQQLRLPPIVNLPSVVRGGVRYAIENGVERAMTSQEVWAYHIEEAVRHTLAGGTIGGLQDAIDQAAKHVGYNKPIDAQEILDSAIDNAAISAATHLTARAFGEMPKPEQQGDPNAPAAFQGATPGAGPGPQPGQPGAGARTTPPPSGGRYGAKARAKAVRPEENSARETLGIPLNEELNQETVAQYVREAVMRKGVHPDRGGTTQTFQTVWDAGQYLKGRYKGVAGEANARPQAEQPAQEAQPNTRTQQAPPPAAEPVTPEAAAPQPEPPKPQAESVQTASTGDDQRKDGLDNLSTPDLRRRARDAGFDPRAKREELIASLRGGATGNKAADIRDAVGGVAGGMVDGMYDRMWDDVRKGNIDTSKAPLPEQVVDLAFRRKQITTRDEMVALAKEADAVANNAKGDKAAAIRDWYRGRFPTAQTKEAQSEPATPTVAKPAAAAQENAPAQTPPLDQTVAGDAKGGEGGAVGDTLPTKQGEVYRVVVGGQQRYAVRENMESVRGGGDRLFDSEADARKYASEDLPRRLEDDRKRAEAVAKNDADAQAAEEAKKNVGSDDFKGWIAGKSEMDKARIRDVMHKQRMANGKATTLAELIEQRVADGGKVETVDGKRRLIQPDGRFYNQSDLSKLALDYAEHLIGKGDRFSPAEVRAAGVPDEVIKQIQENQNAAGQGIESQNNQPEHQGDDSGRTPEKPGGSGRNEAGGAAEGAAGDLPNVRGQYAFPGTEQAVAEAMGREEVEGALRHANPNATPEEIAKFAQTVRDRAVDAAGTEDDVAGVIATLAGHYHTDGNHYVPPELAERLAGRAVAAARAAGDRGKFNPAIRRAQKAAGQIERGMGAKTPVGNATRNEVRQHLENAKKPAAPTGERPTIEDIGHEGKFILVKAPKDPRSIFDADGLGGRYFAPRGGYLFPAKRRSEVQAEIERHYGPKAEKPTKAAPTTLEGLPIEDPDALESLKSIGRTPSESDRINAEMRGQGPKVGDVIPWAKGDRSATVLKVEQGGAGLNPWAKQIDFYTVEVAQHSLHLPGTSGGLAKKIDNLTVNDLMKQGWKPTTTAPENSNPPAAKAGTIKPEATNVPETRPPAADDQASDQGSTGLGAPAPQGTRVKSGDRSPGKAGGRPVQQHDVGDTGGEGNGGDQGAEAGPVRPDEVVDANGDGGNAGGDVAGTGVSGGDENGDVGPAKPAKPKPGQPTHNYLAPVGSLKREGSWLETAKRNIEIIKLVKELEAAGKLATPEQQALIAQYVGFGASEIANNLFPLHYTYGKRGKQIATGEIAEYKIKEAWKPTYDALKDLLSDEEMRTIRRSTQYAHYTSEPIIRAIWEGVRRMGFTGGKVIEPGMGSGLFMVAAPPDIAGAIRYVGVEMDHLTAAIAKQLLQGQNIIRNNYIDQKLPDNFFDAAMGNPPFSGRVHVEQDPRYRKYRFALHDYFFAKTIDKVRPGGILVFVTSRYTMDKVDDKARKYIGDRADLLGAIRLPQTAFKANAGTEVVTDVLFLKKRAPGEQPAGEAWKGNAMVETPEGPARVSEYFAKHPEMVLGRHSMTGSMQNTAEPQYTVLPNDGDIEEQFAKAVQNLPENAYSAMVGRPAADVEADAQRTDFNVSRQKEGGLYISDDGKVMQVNQGVGKPLAMELNPTEQAWLKDYVGVRDSLKQALADQLNDGDWQTSQKALVKAYRAFTKKYGRMLEHKRYERKVETPTGDEETRVYRRFKWNKLLSSKVDAESSVVLALEKLRDDTDQIDDGDILTKRLLSKPEPPTIKGPEDALAVSLNDKGKLDLDHVAGLLNLKPEEAIDALGNLIYEHPGEGWKTADEYLSGDVVGKLEEAKTAMQADPNRYRRNVDALSKVQPAPLGTDQILVRLGANWIPPQVVQRFASELLGINDRITYQPSGNIWDVPSSSGAGSRQLRDPGAEYGTGDRSAAEILSAILNNQELTIKRTDSDNHTYTDQEATTAVNEKAEKQREKFAEWFWTDAGRAREMLDLYNRKYNNLAPRKFDGKHMTLPGLSSRFKKGGAQPLHPHQLQAIWRVIQTGNAYLAHAVGAGKTLEMIVSAMEQKRLGLIKKPMFVVPNHMLEQFSNEFILAYPAAKILVADEDNFGGDQRKRFVAKAGLNDWDAIIIKQSSFKKIGVKEETANSVADDILSELRAALDSVDGDDKITRKRLEAQIEAVEQKVAKMTVGEDKDNNLAFEDLGVDFLYVDEAHLYRKLDFSTNRKVKGIDPNGSGYAFDMFAKLRHLASRRPDRYAVLASGTPVTNTLAEMYTIQRYLDYDGLRADTLHAFDAWANMFGQAIGDWERNAIGQYEKVERFSRFVNVPELMNRVRTFMDVLTMEELGHLVTRPDLKGGRPEMRVAKQSEALKTFMAGPLKSRLEISKNWKPSKEQPGNPDPVFNIAADGVLAALDMRFVYPNSANDPGSKLNLMIDGIIQTYKATKDNVYTTDGKPDPIKGATQIVFSPVGFGEGVAARGFDARKWITQRLVKAGIKSSEIAFMGDYKTDAQKEEMFKQMREGKKRVLLGSPKNMGTGVNVQKRLIELHYLAPPWFPADIEQPHGRILRQGNQNKEATIGWYVTEATYDATMWGMVRRKGTAIEQAFRGSGDRSIEDISEVSQYTMAEAVASGDDRVIQLANLQGQVEKMRRLQQAHHTEQREVVYKVDNAKYYIKHYKDELKKATQAVEAVGDQNYWSPTVTIGGKELDKAGEIGTAVFEALGKLKPNSKNNVIGKVGAFDILASSQHKGGTTWAIAASIGPKAYMLSHSIDSTNLEGTNTVHIGQTIRAALKEPRDDQRIQEGQLAENEATLKKYGPRVGAPFEHSAKLAETIAEHARLQEEVAAANLVPAQGTTPPPAPPDDSGAKLNTTAKPFYSKLQRVIAEKMPAKATPEAVRALVTNAAVKADELKWSGLGDYLKDKTGPVTKAEVEEYLRENDVRIEEVMKGQPKAPLVWTPVGNNGTVEAGQGGRYLITPLPSGRFELRNRRAGLSDLHDTMDEAKAYAQEIVERSGEGSVPTKFSQYQLPGGKNYRELLLTLPKQTSKFKVVPHPNGTGGYALQKPDGSLVTNGPAAARPGVPTLWSTAQMAEQYGIRAHDPNDSTFHSGHWDEPNVLAHVRFSDRVDADGKKVLHVEEVQSDWHQQGREKGYRDADAIEKLDKAIADKFAETKQYAEAHKDAPPDEGFGRLAKEYGDLVKQRDALKAREIPDAPFAKTWPELAMKRMLRYAAENGYDKLAWTPGEIQNERYDLSKQVDYIQWWPKSGNGDTGVLFAYKGGREVIEGERMTSKELADHVGKELAERLLAAPDQESEEGAIYQSLEGKELSIGGSGMKGFYDKILPDFLNKYAKKWGARVSTTEVSGTNRPLTPSDIDTLQQAPQWPADVPRSVVDRFPADPTWNDVLVSFGSYIGDREAQKAIDDIREHYWFDTEGTTLPSIDITPAMRKSVMEEGQPLFRTQAGTIPTEVKQNGQEAQEQGVGQASAGIPDSARAQYQAALEAHAPDGATVTRHNEGWAITRPDGRTLDVRLVDPEKMPVPRAGFAESVAAHYGGQLIEGPDGNPFRVPATSDGILKLAPAEYDRLRKAMTIGGAYVNGGILLNNQAHEAGMDLGELVREELFHAKFDQDLTDAQRTALLNEYGDEERAFQAKPGNTAGGKVLQRLQGAKLSVLAKIAAKPIKFTGEVAKTIMQAVNWYSEPLVERIEKQAGLMGKRTATTARHANDYARRVVGELNQKMVTALDYVSGKHKQGRKAVRELRQVRMVTTPDVTYGYSVFQSAVEAQQPRGLGPLTLTRAADKAVKNQRAIVMASGDIMVRDGWKVVDAGGKVRPFVPVKDGKRMLRSYTPEYWDAVSRPDFDPMKIAIAKAFGHANGKPWQDMMKEMNDSYDPATKKNAAGGEILRTMKYSPTHVTHPDTGRVIQIMHSEPFDAAAMLVRNFSLRAGYIKHFGQDLPGQDVTNSLIEAFRKNGGNGDDIKNLIKTFHGIPLDPIHMVSPGTFMYQVVRGFRGVYTLSKAGALGLAAVPNLFETLTKTLAMTGVENYARAWATILAHPVLAPRALADLGARTVDIQNWMGRKGHTLEMIVKNASYLMTVPLKLANELNELQSAAAGATFAADLPNSGPNSRNAATLRLLGYNEDEIRDLTSANPPTNLLATVPARIAEQTQGTTSRPSELPNSSHSRVFRTILPFQHWPAMTVNRVLKMLKAIAKPGISARERAHHARILGSMFSGSLLAGTMALLLMAYLRGGKDEVAVKYAEGMDEPTHAAYDALKFSVLGGLATTLGESLFDNHDTRLIGPLLNASMPESMLEELYKATKGVGPYKGETPMERFNTFMGKRVAVAPSIATAMAAWGLGDKNVKLDVALRAYYRWRRANPGEKGESGPDVTGPDGEAFKFTRAMRHYMDAAQRGDDEKALSALSDALDVKAEEVGKGASEAVAAAIRSRQILAHLSSEEQEKLGKHIGRDAYDQLEEYDMVLEGWARMMKPQAKPHAPHPKRR